MNKRTRGWGLLATALLGQAVLAACGAGTHRMLYWRNDVQMVNDRLTMRYDPAIDRLTYFGPIYGPNLLHIEPDTIAMRADPEGEYRFFGGGYSWISPQRATQTTPELGWRNAENELQDWPPDPSIDRGPMLITGRAVGSFTATGPVGLAGLQERVTHALVSDDEARLDHELINRSQETVAAGTWYNTAFSHQDVIALPPGVIRIAEENEAKRAMIDSILWIDPLSGWQTLDFRRLRTNQDAKIYIDASIPEIAIWRDRMWFHRKVSAAIDAEALANAGEGSVAVYINKGLGIFEAELYGPLATILPGHSIKTTEEWRVIRNERSSVGALPEPQ
ncbi:MAG: DUF4380 domain-containing protein [Planctomycetota bacterium]